MKFLIQRFAKFLREIADALQAYRELFRAWLRALAAQLFPVPVKVRAANGRTARSRRARARQ